MLAKKKTKQNKRKQRKNVLFSCLQTFKYDVGNYVIRLTKPRPPPENLSGPDLKVTTHNNKHVWATDTLSQIRVNIITLVFPRSYMVCKVKLFFFFFLSLDWDIEAGNLKMSITCTTPNVNLSGVQRSFHKCSWSGVLKMFSIYYRQEVKWQRHTRPDVGTTVFSAYLCKQDFFLFWLFVKAFFPSAATKMCSLKKSLYVNGQ